MDEIIEQLLKTGRPAPQPEHSFQIIFQDSEPSKESLVMSDDNKPITDYKVLASKFGGDIIKLGEGGATFDPCMEISKLPDDEKDKLTAEAIKIIEKREEERKRLKR
jgi:hypothetical protein